MGNVRVISSSIVQAANQNASGEKIELTSCDVKFLRFEYIQKGLLFHKETDKTPIHHLTNSLARTLGHFPLLAGRLATTRHQDDETISFSIDCKNAGALFIHASADGVTVSDIVKPVYVPPIVHSFFPLNGVRNSEGTTNPLLGIQVTDLADGIFIGCSFNHVAGDGTSFWHFLNSWSEICRGSILLSKPPVFRRWFPDGMDIPIRIPQSCVDVEQSTQDFVVPPVRERIFHFSKENIAKLKAKANVEIGRDNISSLQALLSHIWMSVIRNKSIECNEDTNYRLVVGARRRVKQFPENYFGNAITGAIVTMKAKELMEHGIGNPAWRMNRMIATMTEESFENCLKSWPACPFFVNMNNDNGRTLITSSSPRFDMYGNDFGWGKPIAVRSGSSNKCDGLVTLFCGAEEGSIDVEACLLPETLEAMENDQGFMDTVTI